MATKTRTVAGHQLTLLSGITYRASRPFAQRGRTLYPVTIAPMTVEAPSVTIAGLSYDDANALVNGFNNGAMSFDGRVW